ncbi:MAG TPA: hypothetical protein VFJ85_15990 [Acidimicrobiales bacterium]|nr:hypothetical protein [Acidimicrobiales bacterium]
MRRGVAVALVLVVAGVAAGGLAVGTRNAPSAAGATPTGTQKRVTAKVTTKDLAETQDVSGTLGYGDTTPVALAGHGTVTALPALGSVVDRGGRLAEVDGRPVTLFFGDRPMWRDLGPGAADGPDIAQLEANLVALRHGTKGALGVDNTWTDATTAAVKRWQHALGQPETGAVAAGDLAFLPGAVRVAEHVATIGGAAGGPVLKVTGTARLVTVDLDAEYQAFVKTGMTVTVELPGGTKTPATVTSVGTVAQASQQGDSPTLPVVAMLADQAAGAGLDQAPVTVHVVTSAATGVLAVPVGALLALAEGGYAVEVVTGPATTRLVGVQTGTFADGWVAVTGALHDGDTVVVAA